MINVIGTEKDAPLVDLRTECLLSKKLEVEDDVTKKVTTKKNMDVVHWLLTMKLVIMSACPLKVENHARLNNFQNL